MMVRVKKITPKEAFILGGVVLAFISISFFSQVYSEILREAIDDYGVFYGMAIYLVLTTIDAVVAPVSTLPILPLTVVLWGKFSAAILSIIGWTTGAMVVFMLSRKYGRTLVRRLADIERIENFGKNVNEKNIFLTVILFRIIFPVDVMSYAIGLFTGMNWFSYMVATIISLVPFTVASVFFVDLSWAYQIIIGFLVLFFTALFYPFLKHWALDFLEKK